MNGLLLESLRAWIPGLQRISRLPKQLLSVNPFAGDCQPTRVPLFKLGSGRPTLPFPHPWNFDQPIRILETYFIWKDNTFSA